MAMRSVARDLALREVIVSMLSPGYVDTDLTRRAVGGPPKISARDSGQGLADAIIALTPGGQRRVSALQRPVDRLVDATG